MDFLDRLGLQPVALQRLGGALRGHELKTQGFEPLRDQHHRALVAILHADKDGAGARQQLSRGEL